LPDAVVAYVDSTVALPIITAYALARHEPRKPKRLFDRREEFMDCSRKNTRKQPEDDCRGDGLSSPAVVKKQH
jgi:deoxyhypusine synthase